MSLCYECGKDIVFEAQFCGECYGKITKMIELPSTFIHEVDCPSCSEKMPCSSFVCKNCQEDIKKKSI